MNKIRKYNTQNHCYQAYRHGNDNDKKKNNVNTNSNNNNNNNNVLFIISLITHICGHANI